MKKNRLSEDIQKGVLYLNVGLILIICLTGLIYLFSLGGSSQMGYSFTMQERYYNELKNENETLKLQVLEASSYQTMNEDNLLIQEMESSQPEFYETRKDRLSKK
jgi:hypothetical protein